VPSEEKPWTKQQLCGRSNRSSVLALRNNCFWNFEVGHMFLVYLLKQKSCKLVKHFHCVQCHQNSNTKDQMMDQIAQAHEDVSCLLILVLQLCKNVFPIVVWYHFSCSRIQGSQSLDWLKAINRSFACFCSFAWYCMFCHFANVNDDKCWDWKLCGKIMRQELARMNSESQQHLWPNMQSNHTVKKCKKTSQFFMFFWFHYLRNRLRWWKRTEAWRWLLALQR